MKIPDEMKTSILGLVIALLVLIVAVLMVQKGAIIAEQVGAGGVVHINQGFFWVTKLMTLAGALASFFGVAVGARLSLMGDAGGMPVTGVGVAGLVSCSALTMSQPGDNLAIAALAVAAVLGVSGALGIAWATTRGPGK